MAEMSIYDINRISNPAAPPEYEDHTSALHFVPAPCQVACPVGTDAPSYIAYIWEEKYDEALVQFQKAKELDPNSKEAQLGIGTVHLEKGETDKAIEEISAAAMLNPKPGKAYYWLGAAYEKKGDLPNAVKYYKKALQKLLKD